MDYFFLHEMINTDQPLILVVLAQFTTDSLSVGKKKKKEWFAIGSEAAMLLVQTDENLKISFDIFI